MSENAGKLPHPLAGKRWIDFAKLCVIALFQAAAAATIAFLVKIVFDAFNQPGGPLASKTIWSLIVLLGAVLWASFLKYLERTQAEVLGQHYAHNVRLTLYDHLGALPPRELQRRSRGGHLLRFIGDLNALRNWISLGLARLSVASIMGIGSISALTFINVKLAVAVFTSIAIGALLAFRLGDDMRKAARRSRRNRARLASDISERIALMAVVQAFSQVGRERKRVARKGRNLRNSMIARARVVGRLRGLTEAVAGFALIAILLVGGLEVNAGRTSAGAVIAAISILGMLTPALRDLGRVLEYWHGYVVARERIEVFLNTPVLDETGSSKVNYFHPGPGGITFENVSVDGILKNITTNVPPRRVIAVIGPNGGGKSTLLSLVARMVEADSGKILIDGQDIKLCTTVALRHAVGIVSPDLPLMRGSIKRNICYRWPKAPEKALKQVCDLCGITEMLSNFSEGLDTRVQEGGLNLSLGQRQRITLARAMLGRPKILLLDEADANLDPSSRNLLDRVLSCFEGTILIVSHRPDRISPTDYIWYVADGQIVEKGEAAQLLKRDGATSKFLSGTNSNHASHDDCDRLQRPADNKVVQLFPKPFPEDPKLSSVAVTVKLRDVEYLRTADEFQCDYLLYTPPIVDKNMPVLVAVHGISYNAEEHIEAFAGYAYALGSILVAPLFSRKQFPRYQRFGYSRQKPGPRSDLALNGILNDVASRTGCDTKRFWLFGFSGGGQFAHRYAMAYPERVKAAVLGSPGWYTFPEIQTPFPRGLKLESDHLSLSFRPENFLHVPISVCVGEYDTERDATLNAAAKLDVQQGLSRTERGQRWIAAMLENAKAHGLNTDYEYVELNNCGHSFADCIVHGGLHEQAINFFQKQEKIRQAGSRTSSPMIK